METLLRKAERIHIRNLSLTCRAQVMAMTQAPRSRAVRAASTVSRVSPE